MSYREKFRKYLEYSCPECGGRLKVVDVFDDEEGVSYSHTFMMCVDCDLIEDITDKRNKNSKVEI